MHFKYHRITCLILCESGLSTRNEKEPHLATGWPTNPLLLAYTQVSQSWLIVYWSDTPTSSLIRLTTLSLLSPASSPALDQSMAKLYG